MADELVRLGVDVLLTPNTEGVLALKNAIRTIPIVFYNVSDPVEAGLVDSLARPRGKYHGVHQRVAPVLAGKRLELLKDTIPKLARVAVLWDNAKSFWATTMERKPTAGTRTGSATAFHGSKQRRQTRERVQRSDQSGRSAALAVASSTFRCSKPETDCGHSSDISLASDLSSRRFCREWRVDVLRT